MKPLFATVSGYMPLIHSPCQRLANVAVDAVFDSESIGTTFQKELSEERSLMNSHRQSVAHRAS